MSPTMCAALGASVPAASLRSRGYSVAGSRATLLGRSGSLRQLRAAPVNRATRSRAGRHALQCRAEQAAGDTAPSGLIQKLTGEELEVAIQERDRPLVVDFYATWCGPCVLMAKELEKVLEELGEDKVRIVKVDTDENPDISTQLQIQGLPTLVFVGMDPGKPALRTEGLLPAATVKQIIMDEL